MSRYFYSPVSPGYENIANGLMQGVHFAQNAMARSDQRKRQQKADAQADENRGIALAEAGWEPGTATQERTVHMPGPKLGAPPQMPAQFGGSDTGFKPRFGAQWLAPQQQLTGPNLPTEMLVTDPDERYQDMSVGGQMMRRMRPEAREEQAYQRGLDRKQQEAATAQTAARAEELRSGAAALALLQGLRPNLHFSEEQRASMLPALANSALFDDVLRATGPAAPVRGTPEYNEALRQEELIRARTRSQYREPRQSSAGTVPNWQVQQTDQGLVQVNPKTGEVRRVELDGAPLKRPESKGNAFEDIIAQRLREKEGAPGAGTRTSRFSLGRLFGGKADATAAPAPQTGTDPAPSATPQGAADPARIRALEQQLGPAKDELEQDILSELAEGGSAFSVISGLTAAGAPAHVIARARTYLRLPNE